MKYKRLAAAVLAAALWLTGCGGSLADRLRRRGDSRCPRRLRRSFPKRRRHGGADGTKRPHHGAVHAGKNRPERVGQRTEADHPCATACVRQPGC